MIPSVPANLLRVCLPCSEATWLEVHSPPGELAPGDYGGQLGDTDGHVTLVLPTELMIPGTTLCLLLLLHRNWSLISSWLLTPGSICSWRADCSAGLTLRPSVLSSCPSMRMLLTGCTTLPFPGQQPGLALLSHPLTDDSVDSLGRS